MSVYIGNDVLTNIQILSLCATLHISLVTLLVIGIKVHFNIIFQLFSFRFTSAIDIEGR